MKSIIKRILKEEIDNSVTKRIGGNDKIHISHDDNLKFKNIPSNEQPISFKPKGMWFSFGTEWIDFIGSKKTMEDYVYDININDSKILTLGKENESQFLSKYGVKGDDGKMDVNWSKVASEWSGFEIIINPRELNNLWLWSTWDINSGCVWNIDGINSVRKL